MDNRTGAIDSWTRGAWKWENKPRGHCTVGFWETGRVGQGGSGTMEHWTTGQWTGEQWTRGQCHIGKWDNGTIGAWDNRQGDNGPVSNETMDIGTVDIEQLADACVSVWQT